MRLNLINILIHFLAWTIVPIVIFSMISEEYFWFGVVGAAIILCVYYLMYPSVKNLPYAAIGLVVATLVSYGI